MRLGVIFAALQCCEEAPREEGRGSVRDNRAPARNERNAGFVQQTAGQEGNA